MSKKILSSTGKRIRALRNEKGWNQTEFVEILSGNGNQIARSSMSEIETDVNNPSLGLLVGIAKTLGTTTDYLLLVNDDPFPPQSTVVATCAEGNAEG